MNKIKLLVILFFFSFLGFSQNTDSVRVNNPPSTKNDSAANFDQQNPNPQNLPPKKYPKGYTDYKKNKSSVNEPPAYIEKLYYGCNIMLRYYSYGSGGIFYYDLSPHVGYKLNDYVSAGVQIIYNNSILSQGSRSISYNIIGPGVFARVLLGKVFFLQAEYDYLSVPSHYLGTAIADRSWSDEKMVGIGYKSMIGSRYRNDNSGNVAKLSYYINLMYDISPTYYSPYLLQPLIYRAGLVYNF